jgi:predicted LPLAT superfamily acyltransferase
MSHVWLRQRERGTRFLQVFMAWVALRIGRPAGRALLYPICVYYTLFSRAASKGLRSFLGRALGRRPGIRDLFCHYHCFAATLLDRVYFLVGQFNRFDISPRGNEAVLERLRRGQGCILFGSHLGSFEIARSLGMSLHKFPIKVLMYEENTPLVNNLLGKLNPGMADTVIPIGTPTSMLRVKECLDAGGLVGILCDRVAQGEKTVACKFLGEVTRFPAGPVLMASVLKAPVFLFFGLYRGANRYEIYFEPFAEQVPMERQERQQHIQMWTERYVERLEHYCRLAPYNWFNFYEYWSEPD